MHAGRGWWKLFIASSLLCGCSNGSSSSARTTTASTVAATATSTSGTVGSSNAPDTSVSDTAITPSAAASVLASFKFDDPETQYAIHDHRSEPALVAAAGAALATGVTGPELWAATWIWVNEGDDPAPLLALLTNDDPSIRIMAATGLIARGRQEGFTPLIEALTNESILVGQEPPTTAWAAAATSLVRFTAISDNGPPFDADTTRRLTAQQRWRDWFAQNQATLTFNVDEGQWHAG